MRGALTQPLVERESDGVPDVITLMDQYDIIKDDFDNIMEVTKWPNSSDPLAKLAPKVIDAVHSSLIKKNLLVKVNA